MSNFAQSRQLIVFETVDSKSLLQNAAVFFPCCGWDVVFPKFDRMVECGSGSYVCSLTVHCFVGAYSRVPNKRTGRLLENLKNSHLYALIGDYSFINFHKKVAPIHSFPPILLLIFELSHLFFMSFIVPPIGLFSPIFLILFQEFSYLYFYSLLHLFSCWFYCLVFGLTM